MVTVPAATGGHKGDTGVFDTEAHINPEEQCVTSVSVFGAFGRWRAAGKRRCVAKRPVNHGPRTAH